MGKYSTTRAFHNDRKRRNDGNVNTFSGTSDYLTEVPDNEAQFRLQAFLYGFDPTGIYRGYLEQRDLANYWGDYLLNTGQDWSDIKYPTMMRGYGSVGSNTRNALSFSKNIARLYR